MVIVPDVPMSAAIRQVCRRLCQVAAPRDVGRAEEEGNWRVEAETG